MIYLDNGVTTYTLHEREGSFEVLTEYSNNLWLNKGDKVSVTVARGICWIAGWHSFLRLIMGQRVYITGLTPTPFLAVVTDESTCTQDEISLVMYITYHDGRGQV